MQDIRLVQVRQRREVILPDKDRRIAQQWQVALAGDRKSPLLARIGAQRNRFAAIGEVGYQRSALPHRVGARNPYACPLMRSANNNIANNRFRSSIVANIKRKSNRITHLPSSYRVSSGLFCIRILVFNLIRCKKNTSVTNVLP